MSTAGRKPVAAPRPARVAPGEPLARLNLSSPEFCALIQANGQACYGLGIAISGLTKTNDAAGVRDLTASLLLAAKNLSWNLKMAMKERAIEAPETIDETEDKDR